MGQCDHAPNAHLYHHPARYRTSGQCGRVDVSAGYTASWISFLFVEPRSIPVTCVSHEKSFELLADVYVRRESKDTLHMVRGQCWEYGIVR